ncbi:hypothetical protein FNH22_17825 [Fulvivirga sp. M361]|uniref:hypothetical protein n=1 Tax=Fulvivirga sp. M361 TaxID=2594266 RepID=UPI00117AB236|nr:hypothetical protein [Fulvivirga sp. M361]TRX56020.1 hypothetical protein FNH22_17825 [Fulvivirga sp. M361]
MSSQELDDLFKNKLEALQKRPSPRSWSKVEQGINSGKNRGIWFYTRIAAAVLLLFMAGGVIMRFALEEKQQPIAFKDSIDKVKNDDEIKQKKPVLMEEPITDESRTPQNITAEASPPLATNDISKRSMATEQVIAKKDEPERTTAIPVKKGLRKKSKNTTNLITADQKATATLTKVEKNEVPEVSAEQTTGTNATKMATMASTEQKTSEVEGKTLTFDIEQFNAKIAVAAITDERPEENTPEEMDKKGFKKIIGFVKNIREGDGLAELREAKNNLLALNSKKREHDNSK